MSSYGIICHHMSSVYIYIITVVFFIINNNSMSSSSSHWMIETTFQSLPDTHSLEPRSVYSVPSLVKDHLILPKKTGYTGAKIEMNFLSCSLLISIEIILYIVSNGTSIFRSYVVKMISSRFKAFTLNTNCGFKIWRSSRTMKYDHRYPWHPQTSVTWVSVRDPRWAAWGNPCPPWRLRRPQSGPHPPPSVAPSGGSGNQWTIPNDLPWMVFVYKYVYIYIN